MLLNWPNDFSGNGTLLSVPIEQPVPPLNITIRNNNHIFVLLRNLSSPYFIVKLDGGEGGIRTLGRG